MTAIDRFAEDIRNQLEVKCKMGADRALTIIPKGRDNAWPGKICIYFEQDEATLVFGSYHDHFPYGFRQTSKHSFPDLMAIIERIVSGKLLAVGVFRYDRSRGERELEMSQLAEASKLESLANEYPGYNTEAIGFHDGVNRPVASEPHPTPDAEPKERGKEGMSEGAGDAD